MHGLLVPECRNYRARNPEIFFLRELRLPEPTCLLRPPIHCSQFLSIAEKRKTTILKVLTGQYPPSCRRKESCVHFANTVFETNTTRKQKCLVRPGLDPKGFGF